MSTLSSDVSASPDKRAVSEGRIRTGELRGSGPPDRSKVAAKTRAVLAFLAAAMGIVLSIPLFLVISPFWVVGVGTRRLAELFEPEVTDWSGILEYAPVVGWRPRPSLRVWARAMDDEPFLITTDANGWRGTEPVAESDVVVFGDSFAFAHAADDRSAFTGSAGGVTIKGIGAPGYNMVQSLILMRELAPNLRGRFVLWLIYLGNDLDDNLRAQVLGRPAPFVRETVETGGWEVVTHHVRPGVWDFAYGRPNYETFVKLCRHSAFSRRVFSACEYLIQRGAEVCRDANAQRLVVMTVPDLSPLVDKQIRSVVTPTEKPRPVDLDLPDRRIEEICARAGLDFVPLAKHLASEDYLENDVHWSSLGHRRVRALIERLYLDAAEDT